MIGNKIIKLNQVESTNLTIKQLAKSNSIEDGIVIFAKSQTKGKGQFSNYWESQANKNLIFSIYLQPSFLPINKQFYLSKVISIAIFSFIKKYTKNVKIKWPNDIYVGDKKIAGILIENTITGSKLSSSIVGIGININQTKFLKQTPNPISLNLINLIEYSLESLEKELLPIIDYWYKMLTLHDYSKINDYYLNNIYRYNRWHKFKNNSIEFEAKIIDVLESGQIVLLNRNNKIKSFYLNDIKHVM